MHSKMNSLFHSVTRIIIALILCGILASVLLYLIQDQMIFYPQKINQSDLEAIKKYQNVKEINLKTRDSIEIKGWFIDNRSTEKTKILFYFGGNAEEVSYMIPEATIFKGYSVVLINYRGYGQSQGKPNEKNFCSDALEIYDYFLNRPDIIDPKIIIMGRSIGTGVAVYLARNRKCDGVILVSPFSDFKTLAQEQFPFLPVSLVVKYKFNSIEKAPFIKVPLLMVIASEDKTVSPKQSRRLAEKWGGKVIIKEFSDADHNTFGDGYWQSIQEFLNQY